MKQTPTQCSCEKPLSEKYLVTDDCGLAKRQIYVCKTCIENETIDPLIPDSTTNYTVRG